MTFELLADAWTKPDGAALSEPEQSEPVAWIDSSGHPKHIHHIQSATEKRLYGALRPLFAHPPRREPLSEDLILDLTRDKAANFRWPSSAVEIARAIEQAHGIQGEKT